MNRDFHEFSREEYESRYAAARKEMYKIGLDALLVTDVINYRYFTGHVPRTKNRVALLLLPISGHPVILAPTDLGTRDASAMSYCNIEGYDLPFTARILRDFLAGQGFASKRIGLESNDCFFGGFRSQIQLDAFVQLKNELSGTELVDASDIIWRLRMVKSPAEILCIEKACDITTAAFEYAFSNTKQGVTERQVADFLIHAMIENGADIPCLAKEGPSPAVIIDASRPPEEIHCATDKVLGPGDLLHLDMGVYYNGYCSDFGRSGVVGKPSKYQKDNWDRMVERVHKAVEIIKTGTRLGEIPTHWHSVGLEFVEAPFKGLVTGGVHGGIVIEPGMVICIEEMIIGKDGETYQFEEVVEVTPKGNRILSQCEYSLRIL